MVVITTGTPRRCKGGAHLHLPVAINGQQHEFTYTIEELREAANIDTLEEAKAALKVLLVSAASDATTLQERLQAISNKTFKL